MSGDSQPDSRRRHFLASNLQLRIASALVLAFVVLVLAWLGGVSFRILAAVMGAAVFLEWTAVSRAAAGTPLMARTLLVIVLATLIAGLPAPICLALLAVAFVIVGIVDLVRGKGGWNAAGIVYAGLPAIAAAFLRGSDDAGLKAILFLFVVVWATDILAYFVGRAIGGPKLAPSISPGKTWSGAAGGAVGGVAAGLIFGALAGSVSGVAVMGVMALLLSILSQAGDLAESAIKRRFGVKDSGRIIPGHGGVMDRVDGLVAAAVLFYVVGGALAGWDAPALAFFR